MRVSERHCILLVGDVVVLFSSILLSYVVWRPDLPETASGLQGILRERTGASTIFILVHLLFLYIFGNYDKHRKWRALRSCWTVVAAVGSATLLIAAAYYITRSWKFGRGIFALQCVFATLGISGVRMLVDLLSARDVLQRKRALVVGSGPAASTLADECESPDRSDWSIVGYLDGTNGHWGPSILEASSTRRPASVLALVRELQADTVVVALEDNHSAPPDLVRELMACKIEGVQVKGMPTFYKDLTRRIALRHIDQRWFLFGPGFDIPSRPILRNVLRVMDVVSSSLGLLLSLPLWPIIALFIKLDSPGPVLYSQARLGQSRRPFRIFKFRTMEDGAEPQGAVWAHVGHDSRVTRVGKVLRRSRLDEIPQLWNVLRGEMSIIGPRPERPEFVDKLEQQIPFYDLRFAVRPGITGWAQVNYGYGASVEEAAIKLQYELYYIQENSLLLNLHILLKTLQTVLMRPGS